MAKQQMPKSKQDTTKIPTPYRVSPNENAAVIKERTRGGLASDSTVAKVKYNSQVVNKAIDKRNVERAKDNQKPIQKTVVFARKNPNSVESNTGKTFKQSPLPLPKKKK